MQGGEIAGCNSIEAAVVVVVVVFFENVGLRNGIGIQVCVCGCRTWLTRNGLDPKYFLVVCRHLEVVQGLCECASGMTLGE